MDVQADSLFEAAICGLRLLKQDGWVDAIGPATRVQVEVREPVAKHTVTVLQLQRWLAGASASPNEQVKKDRLKAMLR